MEQRTVQISLWKAGNDSSFIFLTLIFLIWMRCNRGVPQKLRNKQRELNERVPHVYFCKQFPGKIFNRFWVFIPSFLAPTLAHDTKNV